MSSKNKKNKPAAAVEVSSAQEELSEEEIAQIDEEKDTPKLSRAEAMKLFQMYREVNTELAGVEASIAALVEQRSNVVRAIYEGVGKGPFKFDGQTVTIMTRTAKEEGSETSYFFKRLGSAVQDFDS